MIEKTGADDDTIAVGYAENDLSMRSGRSVKLETRSVRGEQRWTWNGKELVAWSAEIVAVAPADRDRFLRYVRIEIGGHPDVFAALQRVDGIPKWLRKTSPGWGEIQRVEVVDVRVVPDAPYTALEGKEQIDDAELARAIAAVRLSTRASRAAKHTALNEAAAAAAQTKPLEAMLTFLEADFMAGRDLPPEFSTHQDVMLADADVQALVKALRPDSEEETKAAICSPASGRISERCSTTPTIRRKRGDAGISRAGSRPITGCYPAFESSRNGS